VQLNEGSDGTRPIRVNWLFLCTVILLSTGSFISIVSQDFSHVGEKNIAYRQCGKPTSSFAPRFWTQGWLVDLCR
ncbi:MAG TPA: hypothetical protein VN066_01425, partial [Rhodocyclaceae bacterium]|nr:hypothetical protein [Rhodocyclaceae bacterium]